MSVQESIKDMQLVLIEYKKYQDEVEVYIELVDNQKEFVTIGSKLLERPFKKKEEKLVGVVSDYIFKTQSLINKDVLYNAIIISLYGNFEKYVDDLLAAYTHYLGKEYDKYEDLPKKLKAKHIEKAAEYLSNEQRYLNMGLTKKNVISQLFYCLVENKTDSLPEELFIRHGGNLKTKELIQLFSSFGVNNVDGIISNNAEFLKCLQSVGMGENKEWKTIVNNLVDQRNQVAHGRVENRISLSDLRKRYVPVLNAVCKAMLDILAEQALSRLLEFGKLSELNPIIKVWRKKIVGVNVGEQHLFVGQRLVVMHGDGHLCETSIIKIMRDNKSISKTVATNKDVTLELDIKVKENCRLYSYGTI